MEPQKDCFVIMAFHPDTDSLWDEVYQPTISSAGFVPRRVDKDENGSPLLEQIFNFISMSPLVIADLTLERPNCYFEVGYAIGRGKDSNLILCCRNDHNLHVQPRGPQDPKVHFDLSSYSILWWDKNDLSKFREELKTKILQRAKLIPNAVPIPEEGPVTKPALGIAHQTTISTKMSDELAKARREVGQWKKKI